MSADFWAGYVSGAIGILVGNPLDLIKTRLQAGPSSLVPNESSAGVPVTHIPWTKQFENLTALARGAAAPILGYGALNALLFMTYNRSLALLNTGKLDDWPERPSALSIWAAGALGGLAIFFVSAPTELVKCRAQVSQPPRSSLEVTKDLWRRGKLPGLYMGGGITSVRDSVGYGFYFWSYHLSKQALTREDESVNQQALKVLLCGGLAGVVTWASIFPLDVIKTRVQTWDLTPAVSPSEPASQPLLDSDTSNNNNRPVRHRPSTWAITQHTYRTEGMQAFFRGLGVCSARAFIVNAVQWAVSAALSFIDLMKSLRRTKVYEWMMDLLSV